MKHNALHGWTVWLIYSTWCLCWSCPCFVFVFSNSRVKNSHYFWPILVSGYRLCCRALLNTEASIYLDIVVLQDCYLKRNDFVLNFKVHLWISVMASLKGAKSIHVNISQYFHFHYLVLCFSSPGQFALTHWFSTLSCIFNELQGKCSLSWSEFLYLHLTKHLSILWLWMLATAELYLNVPYILVCFCSNALRIPINSI